MSTEVHLPFFLVEAGKIANENTSLIDIQYHKVGEAIPGSKLPRLFLPPSIFECFFAFASSEKVIWDPLNVFNYNSHSFGLVCFLFLGYWSCWSFGGALYLN